MSALHILVLCTISYVVGVNIYITGPVEILECSSSDQADANPMIIGDPGTTWPHTKENSENPNECPTNLGFFPMDGQCFKYYGKEVGKRWESAKDLCLEQGLALAQPRDPVALRRYLVEELGVSDWPGHTWLGGRGTDRGSVEWVGQGDGSTAAAAAATISNSSNLWYPDGPDGTTKDWCLTMRVSSWSMEKHPDAPYNVTRCMGWYLPYVCQVLDE